MRFKPLSIIAKGMAMGIAEVIPGVSGGTIAFITGIYKTLLDSITAVNVNAVKLLLKGRIKEVFHQLNGRFLSFLIVGMVIGILIGVFAITHMLETNPEVIWALFFGLILASIPYMLRKIDAFKLRHFLSFLVCAIIAYFITTIVPADGSESLLYIFFGGTIAICALVLPGVSGSFMLLMMGLYSLIVPTLRNMISSPNAEGAIILIVFGLGCLVGLLTFSRVVSAAFDKYRNGTIAALSGFMLGSLNKIWPWRNVESVLDKTSGNILDINSLTDLGKLEPDSFKVLAEQNVLPTIYWGNPKIFPVIVAFLIGMGLIYFFSRIEE